MKISNSEEAYSGIHFFNESEAVIPVTLSVCSEIVALIERDDPCHFQLVEIAFVGIKEIIRVNQEHLKRNYVTDVISFRYDDDLSNQAIEGTLYCCAPRILEQAKEYKQPKKREFCRVVTHGLLHLIGYEDESKAAKKEMQIRENFYLEQLQQ